MTAAWLAESPSTTLSTLLLKMLKKHYWHQEGWAVDTDIFAPIRWAVRRRAVWLGINLLTALLAVAVISMFEETIIKVVALAALMPVTASMGSIAGTQNLM